MQRRRADIRQFLDEETPFPSDRQSKEVAYKLSPAYRDLFDDVIAYARETVSTANGAREQRINWWSVLALSPARAGVLAPGRRPDTRHPLRRVGRRGRCRGRRPRPLCGPRPGR